MKRDLTLWGAVAALFLLLIVLASGCGGPATVARKAVTGADLLNAQAARFGRVAVKQCIDKAIGIGKSGKQAEAEAKLQSCSTLREKLVLAMKLSIDATDVAAAGIDVAEAAQSKDFVTVLGPMLDAARALGRLLTDAGVKLPSIPGVL